MKNTEQIRKKLEVEREISLAGTIPSAFYRDKGLFQEVKEKILLRSWHFLVEAPAVSQPGQVFPLKLLPGVLDEPLLLTHDQQQAHCLSNVCTHRGNVLVEQPGNKRLLSCAYHGKCFDLSGRFRSMPEFDKAKSFPSESDHLPKIPFYRWLNLFWASLFPEVDFEEMIRPIQERMAWLPLEEMSFKPEASTDYRLEANWALYVDNYLEGFHIPFVHPTFNRALEFEKYDYEIYPYCNLQLGIARQGEKCFDIPTGHPDAGKDIYAYY